MPLKLNIKRKEDPAIEHCSEGSATLEESQSRSLKKGDRVLVDGRAIHCDNYKQCRGVVQFVGYADEHLKRPRIKVGICLYDNVYSTHNGIYNGKRYFFCPRGHGALVNYSDVTPLQPVEQTQPLSGNKMFPSFTEVKKRRSLREKKIQEAEEMLRLEHHLKVKAQKERYSKSAVIPSSNLRHTRTSSLRQKSAEDKMQQHFKESAFMNYQEFERQQQDKNNEALQFKQMKKVFGGDEKAERMANTLLKLQLAFEEGKKITSMESNENAVIRKGK
ncbi:uncharacterized protein LOC131936082 [Physella acuta]|uniref:uncharacterized protein LOC131936082 n=1 Tax=Physella acuta TaxID=109671 RepID=UPI0027DE5177|nr:uncharacterized protein LOC131936082 [Physella acuta]